MEHNLTWNFRNHTAVVSAGARGIGRATVQALAQAGAQVVFGDNDEQGAEETLRLVSTHADRVEYVPCDFADLGAWDRILERIDTRQWRPTLLVANVGIGMNQPLASLDITEFERVQRINVTSGLLGAQKITPYFQNTGSIVFLSSSMTRCIFPNHTGYTISKAAIVGMTRSLAIELAPRNIRVNCVLPGFVPTGYLRHRVPKHLWDDFDRAFSGTFDQVYANLQPLPERIGPDLIAESILFLCSSSARTITGLEMMVDGGLWLQSAVDQSGLQTMDLVTPEIAEWLKAHGS